MTDCYDLAALRHFADGDVLQTEMRLANADQLFGLAAECAIKHALWSPPAAPLDEKFRKHVNRLWDVAPVQSLQKRYPGLVSILRTSDEPFSDWSIDQRYGPDHIVSTEALAAHRRAASRVLGSVGLSGSLRRR